MNNLETLNGFQRFFFFMGPWKWIMILLAVIVIILIAVKKYEFLIRRKANPKHLNAILFWGCTTALLGIVAQFSGFWMTLNEITKAPDISPPILLTGYLSSFVAPLFGLIVLLVSAISWWVLRNIYFHLKESNDS